MAKAIKRTAKRQKKLTRSNYIRILVCLLVVGGFLYTLVGQQLRLISIRRETAKCKEEIALQEKEYERLKEKAEYSSSDEFYEDKVRDEGYVRDDEIVFVVGN